MRYKRWGAVLVGLVCALGLAYLTGKAWAVGLDQGWDFRVIWVAGRVWRQGGDPYNGEVFFSTYARQFGQAATFHQWFYPPNWYLIASALGRLSFEHAGRIWGCISVVSLMAGAAGLARAASPALRCPASVLFAALWLLLVLLQDTAISLSIGQTSCVLFLGASCILMGLTARTRGGTVVLVLGLTLVALKPNVGLPLWFAAIGMGAWLGLAWAALAVTLSTLPAFYVNGVSASIRGFLANLAHYRSVGIDANLPPDQTGLVNLMSLILPVTPSTGVLVAVATAAAWLIGWRARTQSEPVLPLLLLVSLLLVLVPLHSYDMVLLAIPALLLARAGTLAAALMLLALALALRASAVAERLGLQHPASIIFRGSLLESLGCILLFAGCVLVFLRAQKKTPQG